jgi:hypothetical protein
MSAEPSTQLKSLTKCSLEKKLRIHNTEKTISLICQYFKLWPNTGRYIITLADTAAHYYFTKRGEIMVHDEHQ